MTSFIWAASTPSTPLLPSVTYLFGLPRWYPSSSLGPFPGPDPLPHSPPPHPSPAISKHPPDTLLYFQHPVYLIYYMHISTSPNIYNIYHIYYDQEKAASWGPPTSVVCRWVGCAPSPDGIACPGVSGTSTHPPASGQRASADLWQLAEDRPAASGPPAVCRSPAGGPSPVSGLHAGGGPMAGSEDRPAASGPSSL